MAKPVKKAAAAAKKSAKPAGKAKPAAKPSAQKAAKSAKPAAKPAKPAAKKPGVVSKLVQAVLGAGKKAVAKASGKSAAKPAKPAPKPAAKPVAKAPVKAAKPVAKPVVKATPARSEPVKAAPAKTAPVTSTVPETRPAARGPVAKAYAVAKAVAVDGSKSGKKPATPPQPRKQEPIAVRVDLPKGYKPSSKEPYMNANQQEFFRQKLTNWRIELVEESKQTIDNLRDEVRDVGDEAERATRETENSLELRTRDRYRKLISKIDEALRRIDEGAYGYCIDTGDEIGLERLAARPTAERTVDAQERWEHRQKQMGD